MSGRKEEEKEGFARLSKLDRRFVLASAGPSQPVVLELRATHLKRRQAAKAAANARPVPPPPTSLPSAGSYVHRFQLPGTLAFYVVNAVAASDVAKEVEPRDRRLKAKDFTFRSDGTKKPADGRCDLAVNIDSGHVVGGWGGISFVVPYAPAGVTTLAVERAHRSLVRNKAKHAGIIPTPTTLGECGSVEEQRAFLGWHSAMCREWLCLDDGWEWAEGKPIACHKHYLLRPKAGTTFLPEDVYAMSNASTRACTCIGSQLPTALCWGCCKSGWHCCLR